MAYFNVFETSKPLDVSEVFYGKRTQQTIVTSDGGRYFPPGAEERARLEAMKQQQAEEQLAVAEKARLQAQANAQAEAAAKARIQQSQAVTPAMDADTTHASTGFALSPVSGYASTTNVQALSPEQIAQRNLQATATARVLVRPQLVSEQARKEFVQEQFAPKPTPQPVSVPAQAQTMSYIKQPQTFQNLLNTPSVKSSLNLPALRADYTPTALPQGMVSAQPSPQGRLATYKKTIEYLMASEKEPTPGVEHIGYELKQAVGQVGLSALGTVETVRDLLKFDTRKSGEGILPGITQAAKQTLFNPSYQPLASSQIKAGRLLGGIAEAGVETAIGGTVLKGAGKFATIIEPSFSSEFSQLAKGTAREEIALIAKQAARERYTQGIGLVPKGEVPFSQIAGFEKTGAQVQQAIRSQGAVVSGSGARAAYSVEIFGKPGDIDPFLPKPRVLVEEAKVIAQRSGQPFTSSVTPARTSLGAIGTATDKTVVQPIVQIPFTAEGVAVKTVPEQASASIGKGSLDIKSTRLKSAVEFAQPTVTTPGGTKVTQVRQELMRNLVGSFTPDELHRVAKDTSSTLRGGIYIGQEGSRLPLARELSVLQKERAYGLAQKEFSEGVLARGGTSVQNVPKFKEGIVKLEEAISMNIERQKAILKTLPASERAQAILSRATLEKRLTLLGKAAAKEELLPQVIGTSSYSRVSSTVSVSGARLFSTSKVGLSSSSTSAPRTSYAFPSTALPSSSLPSASKPSLIPSTPSLPSPGRPSYTPRGGSTPSTPSVPNLYGGYPSVPSAPKPPSIIPATLIPTVPTFRKEERKGADKKKKYVTGYLALFKASPFKKNEYRLLSEKAMPYETAKYELEKFLLYDIKRSGKIIPTTRLVEESAKPQSNLDIYFRPSKKTQGVLVQKVGLVTGTEVKQIQRARSILGRR